MRKSFYKQFENKSTIEKIFGVIVTLCLVISVPATLMIGLFYLRAETVLSVNDRGFLFLLLGFSAGLGYLIEGWLRGDINDR